MIFTDLRFLALFTAAWACFAVVPPRWRPHVLAVWGVVFYGVYSNVFLFVVLALVVIVYFAEQRAVAIAAGGAVVAVLALFKIRAAGFDVATATSDTTAVLIPLGLSYLSFELLHVLIERRHGRIGAISLPALLAFAFFAPARIAGPIRRYPDFMTAVRDARPSAASVYAGAVRVLIGLAKKLFVADILRLTVVSELSYAGSARQAWTIVLAYTLQIYLDFSAYTDMAIGFARMMGIALPENFRWPYLAPNIREFWNRWHMTLSHWVRDYVFLPTGRSLFQTSLRSSPHIIAVIGYLVTFVVVGAWHGLTTSFVVWGLYHGGLLAGHHLWRAAVPLRVVSHPLYHSRAAQGLSVATTFILVAVGWVPFMTSWPNATRLLRLMFGAA